MEYPQAFSIGNKYYDWHSGVELKDFQGTFNSGNTVFRTWFENGERAFEVVIVDLYR